MALAPRGRMGIKGRLWDYFIQMRSWKQKILKERNRRLEGKKSRADWKDDRTAMPCSLRPKRHRRGRLAKQAHLSTAIRWKLHWGLASVPLLVTSVRHRQETGRPGTVFLLIYKKREPNSGIQYFPPLSAYFCRWFGLSFIWKKRGGGLDFTSDLEALESVNLKRQRFWLIWARRILCPSKLKVAFPLKFDFRNCSRGYIQYLVSVS